MYFTGETSRQRIGLGGRSRREEASKAELLERARREREQRARKREENAAATKIQVRRVMVVGRCNGDSGGGVGGLCLLGWRRGGARFQGPAHEVVCARGRVRMHAML